MKKCANFLTIIFVLMITATLSARQTPETKIAQNTIQHLQQISLATSNGDTMNVGAEIGKNPFTLIVMYRGVW